MAKINVLQCNLQRSVAAHALMEKTATENNAAMVIISEPNWNLARRNGLFIDTATNVAIKTYEPFCPRILNYKKGPGFVWIELPQLIVYGCYISPNVNIDDYKSFTTALQLSIRQQKKEVLIAGDFNAKSIAWGCRQEDEHGTAVMEIIASENLVVLNTGSDPTFQRGRTSSCIDITISTEQLSTRVSDWKVLSNVETLSDHLCISFLLDLGGYVAIPKQKTKEEGWKYSVNLESRFCEEMDHAFQCDGEVGLDAVKCTKLLTVACNNSLPKKRSTSRKPVYWWNKEIAECRKICIAKRRASTRANRKNSMPTQEVDMIHLEYTCCRRTLRKMIADQKRKCWKQIQNDIDGDIWGLGYRIVTKKFARTSDANIPFDEKLKIVEQLFPRGTPITQTPDIVLNSGLKMFTREEIQLAAVRLKSGKATGPDNLPPEVVKAFVKKFPDKCLNMINNYLSKGIFPKIWKSARLVLLEKGKTATFRPLCLLNVLGKLYEHLLLQRLKLECDELSESQYGFREGKSTIDAVNAVLAVAKAERTKAFNNRGQTVLVTLDIRNAFNTVPWPGVIEALRQKNTPPYLIRVIKSYLHDRSIIVDGKTVNINTGVPQGSVMGPFLWNVYYDQILCVKLLRNVQSVAFADDLAIVITAKNQELLQEMANGTIQVIKNHLEKQMFLTLAPEKTEVVLLTSKRKVTNMAVTVGDIQVSTSPSIKYLGIWLDRNIKMVAHLHKTIEKAEKAAQSVCRLMPNLEGPRSSKRRVLCSVILSVILYGAAIWEDVLRAECYRHQLERCMRRPKIRTCSAYRTISNAALDVISGIPPIHLLVKERASVYRGVDKKIAAKAVLDHWNSEWNDVRNLGTASWTKILIRDIDKWTKRTHGEINYFWTQFLSGHGQFKAYLKRMKVCESNICKYCFEVDTVAHTFFACPRWGAERAQINQATRSTLNEDNIIEKALSSTEQWNYIQGFIEKILRQKEVDFRR